MRLRHVAAIAFFLVDDLTKRRDLFLGLLGTGVGVHNVLVISLSMRGVEDALRSGLEMRNS